MAFAADKIRQGAAGQGGFELDQSLRFNDDDSAYLTHTPASAGNRTTWTWSAWIKLGSAGDGWHMIFSAGSSSNSGSTGENLTGLLLYTDTLYIYWDSAAGGTNPAMKLRDPTAWYHICLIATSSSLACYVNGALAGTKSGSGNGAINNTLRHGIGVRGDALTSPFDGYMAEVHFIDGTAVAATSFGETGDYGEWKPIEVSGLTYGTNGFYLSFAGGGVMTATGGTITTDGDYKVNSFTSDATFTPSADGYVEYLVIGGGGAGAGASNAAVYGGSGGGGAGGYRTGYLAVTGGTGYSIVVGAGGVGRTYAASGTGNTGADSIFSSITSGGGGGGCGYGAIAATMADASAGGAMGKSDGSSSAAGGSTAYGNAGGAGGGTGTANATAYGAGGGGGSGAVGANGSGSAGGNGGAGTASSITGSSVTRAGGGGGGTYNGVGTLGSGGSGGGGGASHTTGTAGTANTGGGGGASNVAANSGAAGGSGIVIIRYKFQ